MSIDVAQMTRCDRCGVEHVHRYGDPTTTAEITPADWLLLDWHRYREGDDEKPVVTTTLVGAYTFAFCPACTAAFVEFAAKARGGPTLKVVEP